MDNLIDYLPLEKNLQYVFTNKSLLGNALCHSSFVNEQASDSIRDNERLEFLGDAVLNLIVGHILMEKYPDMAEGDLSRMRANLVNESRLSKIAKSISLGDFILLGKGELQTNGREKKSILADALEAVIAAMYLDSDFETVFNVVKVHFDESISTIARQTTSYDAKSKLQEFAQVTHKMMPSYRVVDEKGPDHDKTFQVQLKVCGVETEGQGKSKKAAEQDAAREALAILSPPEK